MPARLNIGTTISIIATLEGMTQLQLAAAAGVSDKTLSGWKKGTIQPRQSVLLKVMTVLDTDRERLDELATSLTWEYTRWRQRTGAAPRAAVSIDWVSDRPPLERFLREELYSELERASAWVERVKAELRARETGRP